MESTYLHKIVLAVEQFSARLTIRMIRRTAVVLVTRLLSQKVTIAHFTLPLITIVRGTILDVVHVPVVCRKRAIARLTVRHL